MYFVFDEMLCNCRLLATKACSGFEDVGFISLVERPQSREHFLYHPRKLLVLIN